IEICASWDLGTGSHGVLGEVNGTVQVDAGVRDRSVGEKGKKARKSVGVLALVDQEPSMVEDDDEDTSKDKEIDKLMALISLFFKKIYKPTNNNLRTSSNTSHANQDNSPRIHRNTGYEGQRSGTVAGARDTVGSSMDNSPRIHSNAGYESQRSGTVAGARDTVGQKPKRAKDAAYHREKMLLCKQEEAGIQGTGYDNQMIGNVVRARETVGTTVVQKSRIQCYDCKEFGHIARECQKLKWVKDAAYHKEDAIVEQIDQNDDDDDISNERDLLASLIEKLKCEIDDNKNQMKKDLSAHQETISILSQAKEAQIKLYKTCKDKELDKVIALENKVKVLDNIVYKTGQSVQTMNMLNSKCKTSFAKSEFLKKAQRANPRLYEIGCYTDNLVLMLAPESDAVICLEKESRSKLSDLIRPFDYEKLNNLYDLFVPQREKSSTLRYFLKRSKISHTPVNNENSMESFSKQTTLLEKRLDESIPYDQKCKSSKELFKIKRSVAMIFDGVERCKQTIAKRTYFGNMDPFIQNTIEANICPEIRRINADLENFHVCLKEEMVVDLRYFNSLELEVDSLRSQLDTQKIQFLFKIY
nr:hypothetical protein [Tanacetum cinerariifolium]